MARIKSLVILLALCASVMSSCEKDDQAISGVFLSAKVDGSTKEAKDAKVSVAPFEGMLAIVGVLGTTESITLLLPINLSVKEYSLTGIDAEAIADYANGPSDLNLYSAVSGSIKVTAISGTNIEGTFSFVGKNDANASKTVTEGKFNAKR
ncbi:MAG: hypothetical protein H7Y13_00930 [Sphingobacteriaceae bacterium]|nr:hypothetical protein [Sphingobacteriaceae bacterium]